jgi:mono/diheme cytochrome c family protein
MRLILLGFGAALLAGCDSGTQERDSVASTRAVQRAYVPVPPGTVARGAAAQAAALSPPGPEVTPQLVARGEDRFRAFCSPCHGVGGRGDGSVVAHGFPPPPSYHEERLRVLPPKQIVQVITRGKGRMYPYADRIPPQDRWAIAHYVKMLQARGMSETTREPANP